MPPKDTATKSTPPTHFPSSGSTPKTTTSTKHFDTTTASNTATVKVSVQTQDDDYPIETLQAIIARVKLDISLHQKDAVEIRALQARYTKWPKIHASFNDEIETTEKAILKLEDRLANYEQELREELAKTHK